MPDAQTLFAAAAIITASATAIGAITGLIVEIRRGRRDR